MKVTKSSSGVPRLSYTGRDDRHFLPTGLYIIKTVNGACFSHLLLFLSAFSCRSLQVLLKSSLQRQTALYVFSPQSRGQWPTVKTPWRSSSSINSQRSPLMTCLLTLLLPFSMFLPPFGSIVTYFRTCAGMNSFFAALSAVFATLSASSGPGWTGWLSMIHRRGWTPKNCPKMMSCPLSTRSTSLKTPAELLNFTCLQPRDRNH